MNKKAGLRGIILLIIGLFLAGNAWSDEQYWVNPDGTFKCELAPGSNIPCPSIIISGTNGDRAYADSGSNCCNHGSNGTCTYTGYSYQTTTGSCETGDRKMVYKKYTAGPLKCNSQLNGLIGEPSWEWQSEERPVSGISCQGDCSPAGQKKYKYTADSGGCSYSTEINTCCANGYWSGFEAEGSAGTTCSSGAYACDSTTTCWNGSSCEAKAASVACSNFYHGSLGTATRSATCILGVGWQYGDWDKSACHCDSTKHEVWVSGFPSECVWFCNKPNVSSGIPTNLEGGCNASGGTWQYSTSAPESCLCNCPRYTILARNKQMPEYAQAAYGCYCYKTLARDQYMANNHSNTYTKMFDVYYSQTTGPDGSAVINLLTNCLNNYDTCMGEYSYNQGYPNCEDGGYSW